MEIVVTDDNSKTLHNPKYNETYHSKFGAVTESRTIFIEGSDLAAAFKRKSDRDKRAYTKQDGTVRVLEIGFGLGLNFLLSADLAKSTGSALDYLAIEKDLLPDNTLQQLDYHQHLKHPEIALSFYQQLSRQLKAPGHNSETDDPQPISTNTTDDPSRLFRLAPGISLTLFEQMAALDAIPAKSQDAIYLDAFSPDCNPECWTPEILELLAGLLGPQGALLTYSAKGTVRRRLLSAGLQVERLPGPPGKREFIKATPQQ